ncbi:hypothetical protein MMC25_003100 [Agyrium rufum]|nr:hypothetical protein [Agyrium rufum]
MAIEQSSESRRSLILPPRPDVDLANKLDTPVYANPRLSMPFAVRLFGATAGASIIGLALGTSYGSQGAALRFRAENAHRLPRSTKGWYLYHKSKNYHVLLGGAKEGMKMAGKLGFLVGSFFVVEESVDRARGGSKDAGASLVAGLTVAGGFSAWSKSPRMFTVDTIIRFFVVFPGTKTKTSPDHLPLAGAAKNAKMGMVAGLAVGVLQDLRSLMRGQKVSYIETAKRLAGRRLFADTTT